MQLMENIGQKRVMARLIEDPTADKAKVPFRFWEIEEGFKCPVVGMCMTLTEQKQLMKKSKMALKGASPFDIHEAIVACSDNENRISRRADRLLQRKFGKTVSNLLMLDHGAFFEHFKSAEVAGELAAALWATAIHPDLPMTMRRDIFGRIHMGMHFSGEERMKLNRKLAGRESELEDLRRCNKEIAQQRRVLEKEIQHLNQSRTGLKTALAAAETELARLRKAPLNDPVRAETGEPAVAHPYSEKAVEGLHDCNRRQQRRIDALLEKNKSLASKLGCQSELNRRIKSETRTIIADLISKSRCDQTCPSFDLCQKRILIVGGMSRMASLYRELIESSGGVFEYHDGYMKKGSRQLESRLRRADVVLCPVNCNSHNACSLVKRLAKKHRKPLHMLANSSLQAISRVIREGKNARDIVN